MKFVLACFGTRGDVEPGVTLGRELLRRGHEVHIAVTSEMVGFVESAGLTAATYGVDAKPVIEAYREFTGYLPPKSFQIHELIRSWRRYRKLFAECWSDIGTTLTSLADRPDLLFTGLGFQEAAANVAEYYDIPLATLHWFPQRVNSQQFPYLPAPLSRAAMTLDEWLYWQMTQKVDNTQRSELGLPKTTASSPRRIAERGSLELQGYDEVCFPGLAAEWARLDVRRPFVGVMTAQLPTNCDDEVASWIAAGTPPIYFGFGSMWVESPVDTLAMISEACAQLGERALVCSGQSDWSDLPHLEHVKIVSAVNHSVTFPACRAVVHHGGSGTTAAGLRAGVPSLILWTTGDQPLWGDRVKRLRVGTTRRFLSTTRESLIADLRTILAPQFATRARALATRMTEPADSVAKAADLVEGLARRGRVGLFGKGTFEDS